MNDIAAHGEAPPNVAASFPPGHIHAIYMRDQFTVLVDNTKRAHGAILLTGDFLFLPATILKTSLFLKEEEFHAAKVIGIFRVVAHIELLNTWSVVFESTWSQLVDDKTITPCRIWSSKGELTTKGR